MTEPKVGERVAFWSSRHPGHLSHGKVIQIGGGRVFVESLRTNSLGLKNVSIMSLSGLVDATEVKP